MIIAEDPLPISDPEAQAAFDVLASDRVRRESRARYDAWRTLFPNTPDPGPERFFRLEVAGEDVPAFFGHPMPERRIDTERREAAERNAAALQRGAKREQLLERECDARAGVIRALCQRFDLPAPQLADPRRIK